jgi:hypothetical protein
VPPLVNGFVINAEWTSSARRACRCFTHRRQRLTGGLVRFEETQFQPEVTKAMRRSALWMVGRYAAGLQSHGPRPNREHIVFQDVEIVDHAASQYIVIGENRDIDFGPGVR